MIVVVRKEYIAAYLRHEEACFYVVELTVCWNLPAYDGSENATAYRLTNLVSGIQSLRKASLIPPQRHYCDQTELATDQKMVYGFV